MASRLFDECVERLIASKRFPLMTLAQITTTLRAEEPTLMDAAKTHQGVPDSRVVDKALQRLRKAGRIFFMSPTHGWKVKAE